MKAGIRVRHGVAMGSVLSARRISVVLRAASFVLVLETDLFDVIALPLFHLRMIVHRKEEVIFYQRYLYRGPQLVIRRTPQQTVEIDAFVWDKVPL